MQFRLLVSAASERGKAAGGRRNSGLNGGKTTCSEWKNTLLHSLSSPAFALVTRWERSYYGSLLLVPAGAYNSDNSRQQRTR